MVTVATKQSATKQLDTIVKRDGRAVSFDIEKIISAIEQAFDGSNSMHDSSVARQLAQDVIARIEAGAIEGTPSVESVQDVVEEVLADNGYVQVAKSYILYRAERSRSRENNTALMRKIEEITHSKAETSDIMRENANIDADTAMGTMLKYGSETAKQYYCANIIDKRFSEAHVAGDIHIHDMDFYTLTTTCCQIDILDLFKGGFSTGHGVLREPSDIASYSALACIAIQSNQNDQHGGQSISNFDYGMAAGVRKTFMRAYKKNMANALALLTDTDNSVYLDTIAKCIDKAEVKPSLDLSPNYTKDEDSALTKSHKGLSAATIVKARDFAQAASIADTDKATHQAMEAFVHNLNTMHSRAGAQTPFSSINYGMDTSPEGRMVIKNILLATQEGLGGGETPIFPIQIFRVKEGVSYNEADPNYDLFKLAIATSAKRLFPNFSFMDAPYNAQYYKGTPDTEVAYMGCRTRVIGNTFDPANEVVPGRGNLSFTSINLPRLGIRSKGDLDLFFDLLDAKMQLAVDQLLHRFEIQCAKHVYNMPFLMGQGVWTKSDTLSWDDEVRDVLRHGTLSMGFIGLAETLVALISEHHGQSQRAQNLGLEIVGHMRSFMDKMSAEHKLNFSLLATPAEGLSGRFVRIDAKNYGKIKGITDRDFYTNSFHVPVYFGINAFKKIEIEAPYHALTNAGHISYVEVDGDPTRNLEAFEAIIRCMKESGIGYGSVNHPVDRDPVCGYNGIIGDSCPKCGRTEDDGQQPIERIRRITGYLVGTLDRFNNGKRAEEAARVKHSVKATKTK